MKTSTTRSRVMINIEDKNSKYAWVEMLVEELNFFIIKLK